MKRQMTQTYLMVTDVEESRAFYEEVLGLETTSVAPDRVKFDTGPATLVLEEDFDEAVLSAFGLEPPGDSRGDGVVVVIEVDDVDGIYEMAVDAGATALIEPRDVDWGRRLFLLEDPDGYVLEISRPVE